MANKTRIAMEHGFMKSIIKNQVDRDNYDKEMKDKVVHGYMTTKSGNKPKKPAQNPYVIPSARARSGAAATEDVLFILEYEDDNGEVSRLSVNKNDDIAELAKKFGITKQMDTPMTRALAEFLQSEVDKRST